MDKNEPASLTDRLEDEADLCRNDGADDIAELIAEAARVIRAQTEALENAQNYIDGDDTFRMGPAEMHVHNAMQRKIEAAIKLAQETSDAE